MKISTLNGDVVVISEFNKNHDPDGRFGHGAGGTLDDSMTREQFDTYSKGYGGAVSDVERELILDYQNSEARPINYNLTDSLGKVDKVSLSVGKGDPKKTTQHYIDTYGGRRVDTVKLLDSKMQHKLKTNAVLYRGLSVDADLKVGDVMKNYGFASTSFSKDLAATFTFNGIRHRSDNKKEYVLKIIAPKGTKGLIPHALTGGRTIEQEFILPRNTDFKISKVLGEGTTPSGGRYQPSYNYTILEVTL